MRTLKIVIVLLLVGCAEKTTQPIVEKTEKKVKTNFLFIMVDDLRPELGCYGADHIKSPNFDELASAGMLFNRAYCQIPVCGASRASLMTGIRPGFKRFQTYYSRADEDMDTVPTLPEYLKANGYYTISNGKIFHKQHDSKESWTEPAWRPVLESNWRDYQEDDNLRRLKETGSHEGPSFEIGTKGDWVYADGKIAKKTMADLEKLSKQDKPFFVAMGFRKPHLPFNAPKKYWDLYDRDKIQPAPNDTAPKNCPPKALHQFGELRAYTDIPPTGQVDDKTAKNLVHGYSASISYADKLLGDVLQKLKDLNLDKNTVVILTGDHGWFLKEHGLWCKHANFDNGLRTAFMIRDPRNLNRPASDNIIELLDIYPTVCEMAGLPKPGHLQGVSIKPLLEGKKASKNIAWGRYRGGDVIVQGDYLYAEWVRRSGDQIGQMLYDHTSDPKENINVAKEKKYESVVQNYQTKLDSVRTTWPDLKNK